MRSLFVLIISFSYCIKLQAQFEPAAGLPGSSALHKDSSIFKAWATHCSIVRGYQDISNTLTGLATVGDSSMALGKAGTNGVVSLGDAGIAIVTFDSPIKNGPGPDFAIFENTFIDSFLELAIVEVSSDGIHYVRFLPTSLTQDTVQTGAFGYTNPRKLNNLAGKYRALWGTPFDLDELSIHSDININAITHIKIIDVVGSIDSNYASYDQFHNKINDPWPTPFPSSGFDLDAVGVIHPVTSGINKSYIKANINIYPNPANANCNIHLNNLQAGVTNIQLYDMTGREVFTSNYNLDEGWCNIALDLSEFKNGCYHVVISNGQQSSSIPLIINHNEF